MKNILIERDEYFFYSICKGIYLQIEKDFEFTDFINDANKIKYLLNFAFSVYTHKSDVIEISEKIQGYDFLLLYRAFKALTHFKLGFCNEDNSKYGKYNLIGSFIKNESQFVITKGVDEELSRIIASVVDMLRNGYTPMSIRKTKKFKVIASQLREYCGLEVKENE